MKTNIKQVDIELINLGDQLTLKSISDSLNLRIKKHKDHIEQDRRVIIENMSFFDITNEAHERIKNRLAKIEEAEDILNLLNKVGFS